MIQVKNKFVWCLNLKFFLNKTLVWASTYEPKPPWEKDIHYHNNDPNVLRRKLSWIKLGMMTFESSWSDLSSVMLPGLWNFKKKMLLNCNINWTWLCIKEKSTFLSGLSVCKNQPKIQIAGWLGLIFKNWHDERSWALKLICLEINRLWVVYFEISRFLPLNGRLEKMFFLNQKQFSNLVYNLMYENM